MSLSHKLPCKLIEQAAEDDVVATLMSDNPVVGLVDLGTVLTMSVIVAASATELSYSAKCLAGSRFEIALTHLCYQFGSKGLSLTVISTRNAEKTLGFHQQHIGIAEYHLVVIA